MRRQAMAVGLVPLLLVGGACAESSPTIATSSAPAQTSTSAPASRPSTSASVQAAPDLELADPISFSVDRLPGCGDVDLLSDPILIADDRVGFGGEVEQLRNLSGLEVTTAIVEATVIDDDERAIALPSGYVATTDDVRPMRTLVGDVDLLDVVRPERYGEIERLLADPTLTLAHWNGLLEQDRRYAFFVGIPLDGELTLLYAHDIETDLPALGFLGEYEVTMLQKMEAASPEGCNVDRLRQLAISLTALDGLSGPEYLDRRSPLVAAAQDRSAPADFPEDSERFYPLLDGVASFTDSRVADPVFLEVLILADEPGNYALRGAKYFGPGVLNASNQTIILGVVPNGAEFARIRWTDPLGRTYEEPLVEGGASLTVHPQERGVAHMLVDLSTDGRGSSYLDGARSRMLTTREFLIASVELGSGGHIDSPFEGDAAADRG